MCCSSPSCAPVSILVFLDSLLRPASAFLLASRTACFNPCFSGFTSTTVLGADFRAAAKEFQSLFFWIHFYDVPCLASATSPRRRFNPCFSGFTSTTVSTCWPAGEQLAFQSLFFWIHFYDTRWPPLENLSKPFQSLFFWIHFYDDTRPILTALILTSFNPCFSGFTSTTAHEPRQSAAVRRVSILVFLDSLLRQCRPSTTPAAARYVSILVFLDSLLRRRPASYPIDTHRVSILVFLDSLLRPFAWVFVYSYIGRFNPCFSGFTSTTLVYAIASTIAAGVSILVFLDSLLRRRRRRAAIGGYNFVSILVFLDSLLRQRRERGERER